MSCTCFTNEPLITTFIPTYNRSQLLKRAIESVLNQTFPGFQLYICDNASCDETPEVVNFYLKKDPRIVYFRHTSNIGAFENFLFGLKKVNTKFFSILADDDCLLPNFYKFSLELFEKYPEAGFVTTLTYNMDEHGNILSHSPVGWQEGLYLPPEGCIKLVETSGINWTGILFRKDIVDEVGVFDKEVGDAADLEFLIRIATKFPFAVSLKPGAVYFCHGMSTSQTKKYDYARFIGLLRIADKLSQIDNLKSQKEYIRKTIIRNYTKTIFFFALMDALNNNISSSLEGASLINRVNGFSTRELTIKILCRVCQILPQSARLFHLIYLILRRSKKITNRLK